MIRILKWIREIPNRIKQNRKSKHFQKYADFGDNLDLNPASDCVADRPGMIRIGNNCRVFGKLISQDEGKITIGNNTCIYTRTVIGSVNSIQIGNCVMISNHVHIYDNNNHPTSPALRKQMCMDGFDGDAWRWKHADNSPIIIEDNVWIGEYSAIMKGVHIGEGSIVAAHAVVTKDVPPYSIAAGNPARVVKTLEHDN